MRALRVNSNGVMEGGRGTGIIVIQPDTLSVVLVLPSAEQKTTNLWKDASEPTAHYAMGIGVVYVRGKQFV